MVDRGRLFINGTGWMVDDLICPNDMLPKFQVAYVTTNVLRLEGPALLTSNCSLEDELEFLARTL